MTIRMSRRDLLKSGALAAAAGATAPLAMADRTVSDANAKTSPLHFGVASYSFRKFDRAHVIEFLKQLKISDLNVKDIHLPAGNPDETKLAIAEFNAAGVKLSAAGVIYFNKDDDHDMREKFEYCKLAGVHCIVAGPTRQTLPRLERFARQYDMRIAIHNHGPEDPQFPSPLDVMKVVKDMDRRIGVCIDVGHAARAGVDVPEAIMATGARLYDVHMKDLADMKARESQVDVGDGRMPLRRIFESLIAVHYEGFVDLEYEIHEDDPLQGMVKSFAYMRGVLAGMGYDA
jgi:sugar phosphate isomerase/epimerase